ncbi:MAG: phosphate ABC transporter permease subunit PstC [Anaerolineales bacterium]|nr:phosphate ABC transporter permease subunit PstC [Anaerolineales bacterium]
MQKSQTAVRTFLENFRKRAGSILHHGDRIWQLLTVGMGLGVALLLLGIGWMLWQDSADARTVFGWSFLLPTADASWNPVLEHFEAWPFIYGTLITSAVALLMAVPISIGIGIFLAELCPGWLRLPLGWMLELLASIPSVVFGLWGIFVFLPEVVEPLGSFLGAYLGGLPLLGALFAGPIPASGASRLAASLILTIMIVPTISAVTRDVFLAIPRSQREAAFALGATEWETISQILVPYGLSGILGAVILGLGRALGETMAVTMVIGNSISSAVSLLKPGYTMSSIIANEFAEAVSPLHSQALIEIGFLLFFVTLLVNMAARFMVWQVARKTPQEGRG